MKNFLANKIILVSGGTGSIGSALIKELIRYHSAKQIRIFDHSENGLFQAIRKYPNNAKLRFLLGDVRDKDRVRWALKGVDVVFHAAALKHVSLNEYSPFEAVKTNVLGTQNLLEAALEHNIERFINISTDKAANPTSTMGASKLLAERLTVGANYFKGGGRTIFASVRFGNVLNSSGSVVPIFLDEIKKGGPVRLTDKRMIRYFMTIEEAVKLIIKAAAAARGGEIFILKMPAARIIDLAEALIELKGNKKIKIEEIGRKPGEKIWEKLVTSTEAEGTLELKEMYVIPQSIEYPNKRRAEVNEHYHWYVKHGGKAIPSKGIKPQKLLTKPQIKRLLEELVD